MSAKTIELIADNFGIINDDKHEHIAIKRFTWKNQNHVQVQVITYGATIISIKYPSKKGIIDDVVLGFDDIKGYTDNLYYFFGATIGRCANVIKNSSFNLQKKDYVVTSNMGKHHFNGGKRGFDQKVWNYFVQGNKVVMSYLSPDDQEGYPGDLLVFASFELTNQNEFKIEYKATTSKPTVVNITNNVFFNLAGHASGESEVNKHNILINADCHTINGEDMLPTGEIQSVLNTDYDLQTPHIVENLLNKEKDGYSKNYCVNKGTEQGLCFVARLYHASSGRILEIYSNQYGFQFDTGNSLPLRCEPEVSREKVAKSPYLKSGVTTFDMLDEIYNRIVDVKIEDESGNYDEVLAIVQDLQKKGKHLHRTTSNSNQNSLIKRSALCLENLPIISLSALQLRYIEKILETIGKIEIPNKLGEIKILLENVLSTNKQMIEQHSVNDSKKMKPDLIAKNKVIRGKKGTKYFKNTGIVLTSQNYPDAINNPKFPSPVLKPGQTYTHNIVFKFWVKTDQVGISGIV